MVIGFRDSEICRFCFRDFPRIREFRFFVPIISENPRNLKFPRYEIFHFSFRDFPRIREYRFFCSENFRESENFKIFKILDFRIYSEIPRFSIFHELFCQQVQRKFLLLSEEQFSIFLTMVTYNECQSGVFFFMVK